MRPHAEMHTFFPGPTPMRTPTVAPELLHGKPPRPLRGPPSSGPAADVRLAHAFAGSALEREFSGMRPGSDDPAHSPARRDAAASRGGGGTRRPGSAAGGGAPPSSSVPSPYGVMVPRQHAGARTPAAGAVGKGEAGRGLPQRPSQLSAAHRYIPHTVLPSRRAGGGGGGPRARFPANFPTHSGVPSRATAGPAHSGHYGPGGGGASRQQPHLTGAPCNPHACGMAASLSGRGGALGDGGACTLLYGDAAGVGACGGDVVARGGLGALASDARSTETAATLAELQSLRGIVGADQRDAWRFEQAVRPTTTKRRPVPSR